MKLLAILRPAGETDLRAQLARHADAELHLLWELYRAGLVREMYSPGGPGSVLIVEADSPSAAAAQLSTLPLLADGVMTLEVIELQPFAALGMLFGRRGSEGDTGRRSPDREPA